MEYRIPLHAKVTYITLNGVMHYVVCEHVCCMWQ